MRTEEFVKTYCIGSWCPNFESTGCRAYLDEECDEAYWHPRWRGKSMVERIDEYCQRKYGKQ